MRRTLIWVSLACAVSLPSFLAAKSPLMAWRDPIYIVAGFAGILALTLLLLQPLLAIGWIPGITLKNSRRLHRWLGGAFVLSIAVHVGALWKTSPPDVIDALTFTSPTRFSDWGVIAMWAALAAASLALVRRRLKPTTWRLGHSSLVSITAVTSILHAVLIEGPMETVTKSALCALVFCATLAALSKLKAWKALRHS